MLVTALALMAGGCATACESADGALFCDGQYVDAGANLAACIQSLNACLVVQVDDAASAVCSNGGCEPG